MQSLLYVMAILGCGEGEAPCDPIRLEEARYESRDACLAATGAALMRHRDLPYPVIVADCRRADAPRRPVRADEVALPEARSAGGLRSSR